MYNIISAKNTLGVKKKWLRTKKGQSEKDVKSKGAAKASCCWWNWKFQNIENVLNSYWVHIQLLPKYCLYCKSATTMNVFTWMIIILCSYCLNHKIPPLKKLCHKAIVHCSYLAMQLTTTYNVAILFSTFRVNKIRYWAIKCNFIGSFTTCY